MLDVMKGLELGTEIEQRMLRIAEARQIDQRVLLREAVEQYVEREDRRERVRQDVRSAYEAYKETGLHATGNEVEDWLRKLESGEASDAPKCHAWSGLKQVCEI